jgi:hypothetical protein
LPKGFLHADGSVFLAHQSKVKRQGTQKHNPKSQVCNLINSHVEYQLLGNKDNHSRMRTGYEKKYEIKPLTYRKSSIVKTLMNIVFQVEGVFP